MGDDLARSSASAADPIHVHLTPHLLAISAPSVISGPTHRPAAVVLWSGTGKPFSVGGAGQAVAWRGVAAVVAPHVMRSLRAEGCQLISLNFDPAHPWAAGLARQLGQHGLLPVPPRALRALTDEAHALIVQRDSASLDALGCHVAATLMPRRASAGMVDARVQAVLALLELEPLAVPGMAVLAQAVGLSPGRLSHLLRAELGMPFRAYVLWRKYRRALLALPAHDNLADVAQAAGFYDLAHMTRTFQRYFGYLPSVLRQQGAIRGQAHSA